MSPRRTLPPYSQCRKNWWLFLVASLVAAAAIIVSLLKWLYLLAPELSPEAIIKPDVRGVIRAIVQIPIFPRPVLRWVPPYTPAAEHWSNLLPTLVLVVGFVWLVVQWHDSRDCLRRHRDAESRDLDRQADEYHG